MRHDPAKQVIVDRRRFTREMRGDQRRRQWKCFFTRPFGHKYEKLEGEGMTTKSVCVGCGRQ